MTCFSLMSLSEELSQLVELCERLLSVKSSCELFTEAQQAEASRRIQVTMDLHLRFPYTHKKKGNHGTFRLFRDFRSQITTLSL